jgi:hypothetical protein
VALWWQIFCKPIPSLLVRPRLSSANVQSGCQPLPQAATPMSHEVERLHAYPRAVCKRALLPTCCSDTPPTLFANRRWAAKCMVIQVKSGQVQRRADAVSHASCSLRRAISSPRRPVKQCRISPATAGKMTTHRQCWRLAIHSLPGGVQTCRRLCGRGTRRCRVGGDDNERRHRLEESHRRGQQGKHRQGYCLLSRCAGSADARRPTLSQGRRQ